MCSAAEVQGWPEDSVSLEDGVEDGVFVADGGRARVPFADLAGHLARLEGGLLREEARHLGERGEASGYACQAAEVSVDPETGQVRVGRVVGVHDVGFPINPTGLTGQIEGGFIQGLGMGTLEELRVEQGRVQSLNFGEYRILSAADIPPLSVELIERGDGPGPFGAKRLGEITATPTAAAIANAVHDAIGVRIHDLPVTAEKVYRALKQRGT